MESGTMASAPRVPINPVTPANSAAPSDPAARARQNSNKPSGPAIAVGSVPIRNGSAVVVPPVNPVAKAGVETSLNHAEDAGIVDGLKDLKLETKTPNLAV